MFIGVERDNLTPDKLKAPEARPLFTACDRALHRTVEYLMPEHVVGVGRFAADRAKSALDGLSAKVGGITHPSPANPRANRGWEARVAQEFRDLGIEV
jgi:single-strand selective monofunctional uracil DNA glycosylase